ncbi:MAG TPA: type II toxin-antitoxin system VapC family toxin [Candidatus Limnocylindria bacterium]|nr:type II toxin-antitoxin system VapC family toxin [Candidatus Limnocylindria bacterium]
MPIGTDDPDRSEVLLDTSAAVALLLEDHETHAATLAAVRGRRLGLAGHAWYETYSVLTRLPAGLRRSPADALRLLEHNFPGSAFLGEGEAARLGPELARLGISGGAVYDALVGAAARQHRRTLLSGDARARPIYDALGADVEIVERS